jgi:hypothetical protein
VLQEVPFSCLLCLASMKTFEAKGCAKCGLRRAEGGEHHNDPAMIEPFRTFF